MSSPLGQRCRQRCAQSPREGADPGDELHEVEGLGQVVIRAKVETFDPVLYRARGGQHKDAGGRPLGHEQAADLIAMDARQIAVEDDDVVLVDRQVTERIGAVQGDIDGHAFLAQAGGDGFGQHLVIFDDEQSHGHALSVGLPSARGEAM